MRVLLVKLSSMGDIIHTLPALTDAAAAIPNIKFTWLIEEGFQEIAAWHPAVEKVIPIALRKKARTRQKLLATLKQLRLHNYDLIIDAQGLLKSAILTRLARGKLRAGYDRHSCREAIASLFYNRQFSVSKDLHAIARTRNLFAQAFGYAVPTSAINYGINFAAITKTTAPLTNSTKPYLVFLHGTTWESKHWPDAYWQQLADLVAKHDLAVQVTWATPEQKLRAQALAAHAPNVIMLDHLSINQAAQVLYNAQGVVAVDTGFAHLAAAIDKPLVGMYGPTDIKKCGVFGNKSINLDAKFACAPCSLRVCNYAGDKLVNPPCFAEITPQLVWDNLAKLL